jgi:hypothetical protein
MADPITTALLLAWLKACSAVYGVDPAFAQAVAIVESRPAGGAEMEFRVGRLGKSRYYGPFGIEKSFLKKWDIANPFVNVEVGVKALRGKNQMAVLRRYNPTATTAYIREVKRITRKLKEG